MGIYFLMKEEADSGNVESSLSNREDSALFDASDVNRIL